MASTPTQTVKAEESRNNNATLRGEPRRVRRAAWPPPWLKLYVPPLDDEPESTAPVVTYDPDVEPGWNDDEPIAPAWLAEFNRLRSRSKDPA